MDILLIEDHPLYRQALCTELGHVFSGTAAITEVGSLSDGFGVLNSADFDLIILDLNLPDANGLQGLLAVCQLVKTPVIVVSENNNRDVIQAAISAGARAYVHKSQNADVIKSVITLVLNGETYVPSMLIDEVSTVGDVPRFNVSLTNRQKDVLRLMAKGCSNKEIAFELRVAETTVRVHVTDILRKLCSSNRTGAVVKAQELGLVEFIH